MKINLSQPTALYYAALEPQWMLDHRLRRLSEDVRVLGGINRENEIFQFPLRHPPENTQVTVTIDPQHTVALARDLLRSFTGLKDVSDMNPEMAIKMAFGDKAPDLMNAFNDYARMSFWVKVEGYLIQGDTGKLSLYAVPFKPDSGQGKWTEIIEGRSGAQLTGYNTGPNTAVKEIRNTLKDATYYNRVIKLTSQLEPPRISPLYNDHHHDDGRYMIFNSREEYYKESHDQTKTKTTDTDADITSD